MQLASIDTVLARVEAREYLTEPQRKALALYLAQRALGDGLEALSPMAVAEVCTWVRPELKRERFGVLLTAVELRDDFENRPATFLAEHTGMSLLELDDMTAAAVQSALEGLGF